MAEAHRGKLKIYMGYAAGVGKTYKMWKRCAN
jgi:K+-sensing histidine kinase KdpD